MGVCRLAQYPAIAGPGQALLDQTWQAGVRPVLPVFGAGGEAGLGLGGFHPAKAQQPAPGAQFRFQAASSSSPPRLDHWMWQLKTPRTAAFARP